MHENEHVVAPEQARRLVDTQFPAWAGLPLTALPPTGTDHVLHRLGDELLLRLPRVEWATEQVDTDARWLPLLAPYVPVDLPEQVAMGEPDEGYPWRWSVVRWLPGNSPAPGTVDATEVARDLGAAVVGLRSAPTDGAPLRVDRGAPLALRDELVREDLDALGDRVDRAACEAVWADARRAPAYDGPPVWLHGDLKAGNLVVAGDRLTGLIDWGGVGVGDPALDLTAGWLTFRGRAREVYRDGAGLDDDAWRRARGWVLTISLRELPYYWDRSPALADGARQAIAALLEEFSAST